MQYDMPYTISCQQQGKSFPMTHISTVACGQSDQRQDIQAHYSYFTVSLLLPTNSTEGINTFSPVPKSCLVNMPRIVTVYYTVRSETSNLPNAGASTYLLVRPETIVFGVDLYFAGVYYYFFFATRSPSSVSRSPQNFAPW